MTTPPATTGPAAVRGPRLACLLRWYPAPSETFIHDELIALKEAGLAPAVWTLYGRHRSPPSPAMDDRPLAVERLGWRALPLVIADIAHWVRRSPAVARSLWRTVPWRRWSDWEMAGENAWAFLCGFRLGRRAVERGIGHLYAGWANGPATAAWVASRLSGVPYSFSAWAGDIFPADGALVEKIRDARFVRATSRAAAAHLRSLAGPCAGKIRLLHNGQDQDRYRPAAVRAGAPHRLLALGRLVRKKGFDVLLDAFALLRRTGFDGRLEIGGGGPEARRLRIHARRLGVEGAVAFRGPLRRDEVPGFLAGGGVFVMPSRVDRDGDRDGIPNVIMEALLNGLPVVASDVGGIGELVRDGETGRLVPPEDPASLAGAIRQLAETPGLAARLACAGGDVVRRDFDLRIVARRLASWFAEGPEATVD